MPCNSDHLEANQYEVESKKIAIHLVYLFGLVDKRTPKWIIGASKRYYGRPDKVEELTVLLCKTLTELTDKEINKYVYNGRDKRSRALADWWEEHQHIDKLRIKEEKRVARNKMIKKRAIAKLTLEEIKAIKES